MTDQSAQEHSRPPPGQSADRIGYFTDAVFAIAMTLLVIEIPRPGGSDFEPGPGGSKSVAFSHLWHFLWGQRAAFYAYLLAFFVLWIVWRQHHALLDQIDHVSPTMVAWHFPLLLLAAFQPYAATVIGHYPFNPMSAVLYGGSVLLLLLCRSAVQTQAYRDGVLLASTDRRLFRADLTASWLVCGYWALSLSLVWWSPWILIAWFPTSAVGSGARWLTLRRVREAEQAERPGHRDDDAPAA
jgi:uncharacterized membrane protein